MKIKELQARQTNVEVEGVVVSISDPREFEKFGKKGRVANAMLKDDSGEVKLSLWNEQIDQVKIGDMVKIQKGYVSEWQGELQLTTGKFGTLEITTGSSAPVVDEMEVTADEKEEAAVLDEVKKDSSPEEAVTPDNVEESEVVSGLDKEEKKPGSLDVQEEEVM